MGKIEELIDEKIKYWERQDEKSSCYPNQSGLFINIALSDMQQLKSSLPTQQDKVVVRQYLADWYEKYKYETLEGKFRRAQVDKDERVRKWYDNCQARHANERANAQEAIAKMDLIGYTVDKEQLYEVRLPFEQWDENLAEVKTENAILAYDLTSGETKFVNKAAKFLGENYKTELGEERIKLIDKRYWAFAVPVEEEE